MKGEIKGGGKMEQKEYLTADYIRNLLSISDYLERESEIIKTKEIAKTDGKEKDFEKMLKAGKVSMQKLLNINTPYYIENGKINENEFVDDYREQYAEAYNSNIICFNGVFYTKDGFLSEDELKLNICDILKKYLKSKVADTVNSIIKLMKIKYFQKDFETNKNIVYFSNGDYNIETKKFTKIKSTCRYRLPIEYNKSSGEPKKFLKYLNDLFYEEDIKTIKQYLGYCLIPNTKAQVMLSIIGAGGEGKSVLGNLCMSLFGNSAYKGSIQKLETDKFYTANLINKLIFIDDDVSFEGLKTTNNLKSIITADTKMSVEQKYKQAYSAEIYTRLLLLGNASLSTLYDKSDGFFRRQIIITTKPKDTNRKDDPYLFDKLQNELQSIANWCIDGLEELINNKYKIYCSDKSLENLQNNKIENCNIISFLQDDSYIKYNADNEEHTANIYSEYCFWCYNNAEEPLKPKTFTKWLRENQNKYNITYSEHCTINNKRARGFKGLKIIKKRSI